MVEQGNTNEHALTQLVVFDGECPLCRRSVAALIRFEQRAENGLVTLQSRLGHRLGAHFGEDADNLDSVWLIRDGRLYRDSEALWRLGQRLKPPLSGLAGMRILPRELRDGVYHLIGRYRRRLARDPGLDAAVRARLLEQLTGEQCRALGLPGELAGPSDIE